jgi:hypothetical protein
MKGAGYYDQNSAAQMSSILALQEWVDDGVANLRLPDPPQKITILDLGSSEGRNAIQAMATIVKGLRRRTSQPVQTIYSDLNSNNFNQLFLNLEEARRTVRFPAGVYASAVGGSFYGRLLAPETVHLATSFNSIQWLDRLPAVPLTNSVIYRRPHPPRPGLTISPDASAAFTRQADQDLVRFLSARARELVPGGKLLLASPGDTNDACVSDGILEVLNEACLDMVTIGALRREQYERLTMPVYFRTVAELVAPLEREDSPVRGAFAVDRAQALEVLTPFVAEFGQNGDAAAYSEAYTGFLRAISEPVIRAALNQSAGDETTVDSLYERVQSRLLAEPERYFWRYIIVAALLTRR